MAKEEIIITDEYNQVLRGIERKEPIIFVTGRAGTGKSTLIELIQKKHESTLALVAPTGIAALNVEGQTIHSLFMFPADALNRHDLANRRCPNPELFKYLKMLVIDEISMVRADMLDNIDYCLRKWRGDPSPFGGVQIVMFGDLFQLPPIISKDERNDFYNQYGSPWFFDSNVIRHSGMSCVELTRTFRHKDEAFRDILNRVRENDDHRESVAILNRTCYRDFTGGERALTLCAYNKTADNINSNKLYALEGNEKKYKCKRKGKFTDKRLPAPEELVLKIGAQIMITKNTDYAVNGSLGKVVGLGQKSISVKLQHNNRLVHVNREKWEKKEYKVDDKGIKSESVGEYHQFPMKLAWAISIHKSQGITLDSVEIDLGRGAFVAGQTYVALSRCRTIEGIKLTNPLSMRDTRADQDVLAFYRKMRIKIKASSLPELDDASVAELKETA